MKIFYDLEHQWIEKEHREQTTVAIVVMVVGWSSDH